LWLLHASFIGFLEVPALFPQSYSSERFFHVSSGLVLILGSSGGV